MWGLSLLRYIFGTENILRYIFGKIVGRFPVDFRGQMYLWPLPFALWSLLINARSAIAIKGQIKALPGSAEQ